MKKIFISLSLFILSIAVLAYLHNFERTKFIEVFLAWTSLVFLVYTVLQTYTFYQKRGHTIKLKFQIVNTIVLFTTLFFSWKYLLEKNFINGLLYNLPLFLILIIFCALAFLKLTDK